MKKININKICEICKISFKPKNGCINRFCSRKCKGVGWRNDSLKKSMKIILCKGCSKEFTIKTYKDQRGTRSYCSRKCRDGRLEKEKNKICINCGIFFIKLYSIACSKNCAMLFRRLDIISKQESVKKRLPLGILLNNENGCFEWQKSKNKKGYGVISARSAYGTNLAHRVAWIIENGPIEKDKMLLHSCDNPGCINLLHIRKATASDNTLDMMNRKRHRPAYSKKINVLERFRASIKAKKVIEIKTLIKLNLSTKQINEKTGISKHIINDLKRGKTWKHIKLEDGNV